MCVLRHLLLTLFLLTAALPLAGHVYDDEYDADMLERIVKQNQGNKVAYRINDFLYQR